MSAARDRLRLVWDNPHLGARRRTPRPPPPTDDELRQIADRQLRIIAERERQAQAERGALSARLRASTP